MLSIEQARQILLEQIEPVTDTEEVLLMDAIGRILAGEGKASTDQPPFSRSPLDGYAVRGIDTQGVSKEHPKQFRVIGKVYAGDRFEGKVHENETVRIMTGAPIPEGADTVIRQEDSDYGEEQALLYASSSPYENYCPQGEDYKKGAVLLDKGCILDGKSVSVLASLGTDRVKVYRKARVGVISTGDELIELGKPLTPGKIYDSNLYYISGRLSEFGTPPAARIHCGDDTEKMVEQIRKTASAADLIITTGGVSVGQKDVMHEVVEKLQARKLFWRVDLKPGAPTLAFVYENTPVISLSGNPFGAVANFELLVRPMIARLTGDDRWNLKTQRAVLQNSFPKRGRVRRFVRGYVQDGKVWISYGNHASGALSSIIGCNCLVEIPVCNEGAKEGEELCVHLL